MNWIKYSFIALAIAMLLPFIGAIIQLVLYSDEINQDTLNWSLINDSIVVTLKVGLFAVLTAIPIGLTTAFLLNKTNIKFQRLFNILILIPLVIPRYIGVLLFIDVFGESGTIPLYDLISDKEVVGGIIIGVLLFPYMHIFITNTLNKISSNIDESALLLNPSKVKYFWNIIIKPSIPAIVTASILIFVYVLNDFSSMQILGINSLSVRIFNQYRLFFNFTNAVLLALIPLAFTLLLSMLDIFIIKKAMVKTNTKNNDVYKFNAQIVAYAVFIFIAWLVIYTPMKNIILLAIEAHGHGMFNANLKELAFNSIKLAIFASAIGAFIAFIFSWAKIKDKRMYSKLYPVIYISYATSGIVLGILWVIVGLRLYRPLYGSMIVLVFALAFKYIIHGIKAIEPGVIATTDSTIESSALLGKGKTRTFFSIGMLGNVSVMISGFTLMFINVISDLNITLLLRPLGFNTMATYIFDVQSHLLNNYDYAPAAVVLILMSLVALVINGGKRYD